MSDGMAGSDMLIFDWVLQKTHCHGRNCLWIWREEGQKHGGDSLEIKPSGTARWMSVKYSLYCIGTESETARPRSMLSRRKAFAGLQWYLSRALGSM